ncbi:MAG: 23S rRNA (guanosine(2251)-2'-O)-methyltransferase RlmB [Arenicellales bacterium]|jgi:23S rRNA (guanosine2251-2'-O)-methyltransferase|nr:23S rRNA (guanosine(2251)-2'-O)-methyltransferase RlmB [Arenicellales bacterium]
MKREVTVLCGFHAIEGALRSGQLLGEVLHDARRNDKRLTRLLTQARQGEVTVRAASREVLDRISEGARHQGVVALLARIPAGDNRELRQWIQEVVTMPMLLVLDALQDPRNLGACLRVAAAAAVDAVVLPRREGCGLTPAAIRVAAGGANHLALFEVSNWARTLDEIRDRGIWLVGTDEDAVDELHDFDLDRPLALVLGSEASGLRPLTRKHCDALVRIPTVAAQRSLNVAVVAGVALFEARRQRSRACPP